MKLQRRFATTGGEFAPESVARFIGICIRIMSPLNGDLLLPYSRVSSYVFIKHH